MRTENVKVLRPAASSLLVCTAFCWPGFAAAQDDLYSEGAAEQQTQQEQQAEQQRTDKVPSSSGLEAIVVTAQRRSERLQDVPISITAASAETLTRAGVTDTQSLAIVTPGLQLTSVRAAVVPFLRGVGTVNITAGDEGATAIYVDGILNPVSVANVFALNNIERIEVLRGPQGTLFGRNAVGGLINIITKDPSHTTQGSLEMGVANYETIFGNGYVTGGLAEGVAADLSVYTSYQNQGWGRNLYLDVDQYYNREVAIRSKVAVELGPDVTATVAVDYSLGNSDIGSSRQPLPGTLSVGGIAPVGTIYDSAGEVPPVGEKEQYGASLKIEWGIGDLQLQSTSAYRNYEVDSNLDSDGTPLKAFDVRETTLAETFQQELLLNGTEGPVDFTVGAFYFYSMAEYHPIFINSVVSPANNFALDDSMETKSYAAFGQLTLNVTDALRLTGGLRYTHDERQVKGTITSTEGFPTPPGPGVVIADTDSLPESQTDRSWGELTWRGVVDYSFTDDVMAYASISRGFKSGVFSLTAPTGPAVDPEILDAYEVGFKADLFDNSLRLNLAAFYYDYKNIQVTSIGPSGVPILLNAAAGEFKGVDGEIVYVAPLADGDLQIRGSFSFLDGRYESYPGALFYTPLPGGGNRPSVGDATGNTTTQSPEFTSSLSFDYSRALDNGGIAAVTATWAYNDGFFWEPENRVREPSYNVVNGQLSYSFPDGLWKVRAFVRNMFDKERYIYVSIGANGDTGAPAEPRTYGLAVTRTF